MVNKLKRVLSIGEFEACVKIARIVIDENTVMSKSKIGGATTRSASLKALELLDIIEVKSMGRNGTRIKVLNGKALKEIAEYRVWGDK